MTENGTEIHISHCNMIKICKTTGNTISSQSFQITRFFQKSNSSSLGHHFLSKDIFQNVVRFFFESSKFLILINSFFFYAIQCAVLKWLSKKVKYWFSYNVHHLLKCKSLFLAS